MLWNVFIKEKYNDSMDLVAAKVFWKEKNIILNDFIKENYTHNHCAPR